MTSLRFILNNDPIDPAASVASSHAEISQHQVASRCRRSAYVKRMSLGFIAPPQQPSTRATDSDAAHHAVDHMQRTCSVTYGPVGRPDPGRSAQRTQQPIAGMCFDQREMSLGDASASAQLDDPHRGPRHAYDNEERAFIMICVILRGMTWKEIETKFCEWFPPGETRRHKEADLPSTYPKEQRTANGLTCVYYRIREQWGFSKARDVSEEQKVDIKTAVMEKITGMHDFPELQAFAQGLI